MTVGNMLAPLLQSRYDCKNISPVFLLVTSLAMLMMGLTLDISEFPLALREPRDGTSFPHHFCNRYSWGDLLEDPYS